MWPDYDIFNTYQEILTFNRVQKPPFLIEKKAHESLC